MNESPSGWRGIFAIFEEFLRQFDGRIGRLFHDTVTVGQGKLGTTLSGGKIMVEVERDFASKGVAGAGLGLGIAGTALGLLNGNGLGGILGGWNNGAVCHENMPVNRYELSMQKELTNKDMEIAYLKGRDAAKTDSLELYRYIDGKFACVERELADQRVYNATNTAALNCMQGQIAQLLSLTKVVVPAANICPQPMAMYNSWTAPTTTTGA